MSLIVSYMIECDHGTCLAVLTGSSKKEVCTVARSRGWLIKDGGPLDGLPLHVCDQHADDYGSRPRDR